MTETKKTVDRDKAEAAIESAIADLMLADDLDEQDDEDEDDEGEVDPGEGYDNPFDEYLFGLADRIAMKKDMDPEDVIEYLVAVADLLAERNLLPVLPEDDADATVYVAWVGAAKSVGFENVVTKFIEETYGEVQEEWKKMEPTILASIEAEG